MTQFEKIGYFIEYMIDTKYIGSITIDKPDRKEVGYYGQGAAEEKALLASRPDLPFSKFVKDKSRHAHGGLAGILEDWDKSRALR